MKLLLRRFSLFFLWFSLTTVLLAQDRGKRRIQLPLALTEVSGLVCQSPDSLWWHTDSGGEAALYLTNWAGDLLHTQPIPSAINRDWEDLTRDDQSRFFIGDFGDNRRRRSDTRIYAWDPATQQVDSILFTYPDEQRYDVEAFFWHRDSLHLFTKSRIERGCLTTYHFVLADNPGNQQAILRDSFQFRKRVVTGAAIDPETGEVALVAYYYRKIWGIFPRSAATVFFFQDYPPGHFLRGKVSSRAISFLVATQYESIDFLDPRFLIVASEKTAFIRAKAKRVRRRGR